MTFILASASMIRRNLLAAAGAKFTVEPSGVDEAAIRAEERLAPGKLALRLAAAKALAISRKQTETLVIGADQVLVLEDSVVEKPKDEVQARQQLEQLRGRTHILHSAVCAAIGGGIVWSSEDSARLTMRAFSNSFLDWYVIQNRGHITDSVGAYKIEETGLQLFEKMEGDYFTILGLPLLPLLHFLRLRGELLR